MEIGIILGSATKREVRSLTLWSPIPALSHFLLSYYVITFFFSQTSEDVFILPNTCGVLDSMPVCQTEVGSECMQIY